MNEQAPSAGGRAVAYCCVSNIVWVKDKNGVFLVDPKADRSWSMNGIDAAIWDWLTLGYRHEQAVFLLSLILRVPEDEARQVICETLYRWQRMGIVEQTEAGWHDQPGD